MQRQLVLQHLLRHPLWLQLGHLWGLHLPRQQEAEDEDGAPHPHLWLLCQQRPKQMREQPDGDVVAVRDPLITRTLRTRVVPEGEELVGMQTQMSTGTARFKMEVQTG